MMRECVCGQCAEHTGQFKNYVQCDQCGLYGNEYDDFPTGSPTCWDCADKERASAELAVTLQKESGQ